jgi:hypothetical protein
MCPFSAFVIPPCSRFFPLECSLGTSPQVSHKSFRTNTGEIQIKSEYLLKSSENAASKVIGIIPPLSAGACTLEVLTQFTGLGSTGLKTPGL